MLMMEKRADNWVNHSSKACAVRTVQVGSFKKETDIYVFKK